MRRDRDLSERLGALDEVLALGEGRLDPRLLEDARGLSTKAGERLRRCGECTVVGLVGPTGSGKSSLFNALVAEPVSRVGLRRPTTGRALAAVWGRGGAGDLLEWLGVLQRHAVPTASSPDLEGLVLVDLPDLDSVQHGHREEAERFAARVDLLVWVLDPQKYADSAVHDRYLRMMTAHSPVMVVVLNQVDRLPVPARAGCLADLRRVLRVEGIHGVPVIPLSTATGEGLGTLRGELVRRVAARQTAVRRLEADVSCLAEALGAACHSDSTDGVGRGERAGLVRALGEAAGVGTVVRGVEAAYRLRALRATGWPFTRWVLRLRSDPLGRLRLHRGPAELVRTALPAPSPAQRSRMQTAVRAVVEGAARGLPDPWPALVRQVATASLPDLPDLLDRAVAGTDLGLARSPRWWSVLGVLQALLVGVVGIGAAWLSVLLVVGWLRLPSPPTPRWGDLPLPTAMVVGGLVLGAVLALLTRPVVAAGARRAAGRARARVEARIRAVAVEAVLAPVERELVTLTALCRALDRVRAGRGGSHPRA